MLDGLTNSISRVRRTVRNNLPSTQWTFTANIYSVYDDTHLIARGSDQLRKDKNKQGADVYLFKSSNEEILAPSVGTEDASKNISLVQVGEGDYRFARVRMDKDSQDLVLSLKDDETMKYQFSQGCKEDALRYQPELPWFKASITFVIVCAVIAAGMYIEATSSIGAGITNAATQITTALQANTEAVWAASQGAESGLVPPA